MAMERMRHRPGFWVGMAAALALLRVAPGALPGALLPGGVLALLVVGPALLVVPVGAALDQLEVGHRPRLREAWARWSPLLGEAVPASLAVGGLVGALGLGTWELLGALGAPALVPVVLLGLGLWWALTWARYLGERVVFATPRGAALGRALLVLSPWKPRWAQVQPITGRVAGLPEAVAANFGSLAFLLALEILVRGAARPGPGLVLGFVVVGLQALVLLRFLVTWTYLYVGHDPERLEPGEEPQTLPEGPDELSPGRASPAEPG